MEDTELVHTLGTVQIQARGMIRLLSRKVAKLVNLKEGDLLQISLDEDGRIILEPVDLVPRTERYLHSPAWQQRLGQSEQDKGADRVRQVSPEELMNEIDLAAHESED